MEKYSFIKFLKIKKKEIIKNIKNLKNQRGGSPTGETYNDHMLNLILLNEQLASLKDVTDNTSVITYNGLSEAIKKIETKIEEHSNLQKTKSESLNPYETINIIESINRIDESLDQNSYLLTANRESYSVPEKVSTGPESEVGKISKFIADIADTVSGFSSQKENLESLNDLDMKKIIADVKKKNTELESKIGQIQAKKNKILQLISNMKQLHSFTLEETVEPDTPALDGFKSMKIPTLDDNTTPFGDLETNVSSMMDLVEIFKVDPAHAQKGGSNKYPKKFLKINIDKNIINLYNEWLETLKNYKNKLKGELNNKLESKKLIGGKINTKIKFKNKLDTNVLIGGVDPSFNEAFLDFEKQIIIIRQKMKELTLIIKRYNVMYIQLINFQNFITNFISVKVLQGGYIVYIGLDFALVSHYYNMLSELITIMSIFDDTFIPGKKFNNKEQDSIGNKVNKWLYKYYYFIIKILWNFFNQLKTKWLDNYTKNKKWDRDRWVYTDYNSSRPIASQVYFLLTIFNPVLSAWKKAQHRKVANFLKINMNINKDRHEIFQGNPKSDKFLDVNVLKKCNTPGKLGDLDISTISKIKFEQIFTADRENEQIPNSMGITRIIGDGESVVIITYGYSGVGKTFTLFGKAGKDGKPPIKGMLQTILDGQKGTRVFVKIFELYGLAVPYKFYWADTKKLNHHIWKYKVVPSKNEVDNKPEKVEKDKNGKFEEFLNFDNYYQELTKDQVNGFENIVQQIDEIRRCYGRIKKTKNNPESSRSIMLYDFKMQPEDSKEVHFVIIDLPGKENIYETFCKDEANESKLDPDFLKFQNPTITTLKGRIGSVVIKDPTGNVKAFKEILEKKGIGPIDNQNLNDRYSGRLIRTILFSNILWISMIPEFAILFDDPLVDKVWEDDVRKNTVPTNIILYNNLKDTDSNITFFTESKNWKSVTGSHLFPINNKFNTDYKCALLRLRAFHERILYTIVGYIENGNLELLGEKINTMIEDNQHNSYYSDMFQKEFKIKYGFVGLEAFYINENILGLLQVLANKVVKDRHLRDGKDGDPKYPKVVCEQKEIYKDIIKDFSDNDYPIKLKGDETGMTVSSDEFYSNLQILNVFEKESFVEKVFGSFEVKDKSGKPVTEDCFLFVKEDDEAQQNADLFKNNFRLITDDHFEYANEIEALANRNIPKHFKKPYTTLINNYNYNAGFNLSDPPIKKILDPFLDFIDNIYVLFVVSNSANNNNENTCDKQQKLLSDTKIFMDVIAEEPVKEPDCP
jgi:hypothetical protein